MNSPIVVRVPSVMWYMRPRARVARRVLGRLPDGGGAVTDHARAARRVPQTGAVAHAPDQQVAAGRTQGRRGSRIAHPGPDRGDGGEQVLKHLPADETGRAWHRS